MFSSRIAAIIFSISAWGGSCERIGDTVCAEGNVMDVFCIDRETLFDKPSVKTLEKPEEHSLHCLVDVWWCIGSGYEILLDPTVEGALYKRGYRLDRYGNDMVVQLARDSGDAVRCSTCTNKLGLSMINGFRATVKGKIITLPDGDIPATIEVTSVEESSVGCGDSTTSSAPITTSASNTKSSPDPSGDTSANNTSATASTTSSQSPSTISSLPAGTSVFSGASTTNAGPSINLTSFTPSTVMGNQMNSTTSNITTANVTFNQMNSSLFTP